MQETEPAASTSRFLCELGVPDTSSRPLVWNTFPRLTLAATKRAFRDLLRHHLRNSLLDAAQAGFRIPIIEDSKQMGSAVGWGHSPPAFGSTRVAHERLPDHRRKFDLRFHCFHQTFGCLFCRAPACFRLFRAGHIARDVRTRGRGERLIERL